VWKLFAIPQLYEKVLKRTTHGTFLQKINLLDVIVYEKMFKEKFMLDQQKQRPDVCPPQAIP
jgi:hypothetical protein